MSAKVNFETMKTTKKSLVNKFVKTIMTDAKESEKHKGIIVPLMEELEELKNNREVAIENGMSTDNAIRTFSTIEVERKINNENLRYKTIKEEHAKLFKDTYALIPTIKKGKDGKKYGKIDLYESYVKYMDCHKRGDFMQACNEFLRNIGITEYNDNSSQIRKVSEIFADKLGARVSSNKNILKKGCLTSVQSRNQFNKLFMCIFAEILMNNGIIEKIAIEVEEDKKSAKKSSK